MALDYAKCAKEIFEGVGGRENLVSAAHCATRLRLVTVDNSKFDMKKLENIDGVKGVFSNNGQLQLIIGTGTVNKVYEEFLAVSGMTAATKEDVKAAAAAQQPLIKRMVKSLGDVFVPILPAIVASGLLMGVVEALGKIESLHFSETAWYGFLDMISNTAFAFLPAIVAISAARVFGGNIYLGAVMGLMMVHPGLINAWNVGSVDVIPTWNLFGDWQIGDYVVGSVNQVGYQGHVIPVIIAIWLMCKIEKWLHKHVPEMLDLFITPITTVFLTALATFVVIGPVFSMAENYVLSFAEWIVQNPFGALVLGAVYPLTVVMGLHHMYNTIEAGMLSSVGLNTWMPIASSANFAQFGACLAVGIKTKNGKTRSVAVPSSMSAALGITEPAIFGINLRFMKPFICAMIGGAVGAIFGAVTKIGATAYGVTGIPGFLTINNLAIYAVMLLISGGIAFILTLIIWKEETEELTPEQAAELAGEGEEQADVPAIETKDNTIYAPLKGNVIPYDKIPDPTFASGVLGKGVGIEPEVGEVVAPFDGTVSSVTDTKHAIGISGPQGMELLIHVGVDTVNMEGDGFEMFVGEGDTVKAGQKLISFDIGKIKAAGYSPTTAVLLTNSDDYEGFKITKEGTTGELEPVVEI